MLKEFWNRLPVIVRAIIVGELVVSVGGILPPLAIIANLRTTPRVPWMLLVTLLWLCLFWWYLQGNGWPRSTAESRRLDLRGNLFTRARLGMGATRRNFRYRKHIGAGFRNAAGGQRFARGIRRTDQFFELPDTNSGLRNCMHQRDGRRRGRSRLSRIHAYADSTETWMDGGDSHYRVHVLPRPSFQPFLCDVYFCAVFSRDQRGPRISGEV
jgi:hypothetical protein